MPRVTFPAPHDITLQTEYGEIVFRALPDEMEQIVNAINKSWEKYKNPS